MTHPRRMGVEHLRWSLVRSLMGSMIGAYKNAEPHSMSRSTNLMENREFALATRFVLKKADTEQPHFATPAHYSEVYRACSRLQKAGHLGEKAACLIVMTWITAARLGDALMIDTSNVNFNKENSTVQVEVVEGKAGVRPSTLSPRQNRSRNSSTTCPARARSSNRDGGAAINESAKAALRTINPKLEARSLRRGETLQMMAQAGVSDTTLLEFSQHSSSRMLHRYLN